MKKQRSYHRAGVRHFWVVDPGERTLLVYRWQPEGYLMVLGAESHETVQAEPFEVRVAVLFGEDKAR